MREEIAAEDEVFCSQQGTGDGADTPRDRELLKQYLKELIKVCHMTRVGVVSECCLVSSGADTHTTALLSQAPRGDTMPDHHRHDQTDQIRATIINCTLTDGLEVLTHSL